MSPRTVFEQELKELRLDVLQMADWVENGYDNLFEALEKKDGETMKNSCATTGISRICSGTSRLNA